MSEFPPDAHLARQEEAQREIVRAMLRFLRSLAVNPSLSDRIARATGVPAPYARRVILAALRASEDAIALRFTPPRRRPSAMDDPSRSASCPGVGAATPRELFARPSSMFDDAASNLERDAGAATEEPGAR